MNNRTIHAPTRCGKTRALALTQQLLEQSPEAAFVVIDPKGDLYDLLKGWAYQHHPQHATRRAVL